MQPSLFIASIRGAAQESAAKTGIPASFTIAQAALESGWGRSKLATDALNLFGVKAYPTWAGDTIEMPTKEYVGGEWVTVTARWCKFGSWLECIDNHAAFLMNNRRYKPAFAFKDGEGFARAVAAAGYATDPDYADKLVSTIRAHDLTQYDAQPVPETAPEVPSFADALGPVGVTMGEGDIMPDAAGAPSAPISGVAGAIQTGLTVAGAFSPLAAIAASLFPKVAPLFMGDQKGSSADRNIKALGAVLDTVATATGSTDHASALARVINDPNAKAAADRALQPFVDMVEVGGGPQAVREFLVSVNNPISWSVMRVVTYAALGFLVIANAGAYALASAALYFGDHTAASVMAAQGLTKAVEQADIGAALLALGFWLGSSFGSRSKDPSK